MKRIVFVAIASAAIAGCASLETEPVAMTHPGHPQAEAGAIPGLPGALQGGVADVSDAHHHHHAVHQEDSQYVCPMHPAVQSKGPASCHICHMALVPQEDAP